MLLGTMLALMIGAYFQWPVLPTLIIGAVCQTAVAYGLTKSALLARVFLASGILVVIALWMDEFTQGLDVTTVATIHNLFNGLAYFQSLLLIGVSTVVGMFGGLSGTTNPSDAKTSGEKNAHGASRPTE